MINGSANDSQLSPTPLIPEMCNVRPDPGGFAMVVGIFSLIIRCIKATKHWIWSRGDRGIFLAVPVPLYLYFFYPIEIILRDSSNSLMIVPST